MCHRQKSRHHSEKSVVDVNDFAAFERRDRDPAAQMSYNIVRLVEILSLLFGDFSSHRLDVERMDAAYPRDSRKSAETRLAPHVVGRDRVNDVAFLESEILRQSVCDYSAEIRCVVREFAAVQIIQKHLIDEVCAAFKRFYRAASPDRSNDLEAFFGDYFVNGFFYHRVSEIELLRNKFELRELLLRMPYRLFIKRTFAAENGKFR